MGMGKAPAKAQIEAYLHYCEFKRRFTIATMKSKRQCVNKFLADHPKIKDLRQVTNEQFDGWCAGMIQAGRTGKTVNNYSDHVLGCLQFLQNKRGEKLKFRLEAVERCEEDPADTPCFTPEEVKKIKQNCRGLRELILVSLIFDSDMRISEVKNLKVENIEGRQITIKGKGRKKRVMFILAETEVLLKRWLVLADIPDGYVFPSPTKYGDPLSVQQIRWSINCPIRKSGIEQGSAHAIRSASLTNMLNKGMSLQDVAKLAGHSNPETTLKHYYKVTNKQLGERFAQAMS